MEIELDSRRSARENLNELFSRLRKLKDKRAGLHSALSQTQGELEKEKEKSKDPSTLAALASPARSSSHSKNGKVRSKWSDAFLSFVASGGHLVVAGRSAKQNDELYAKHLSPGDLFFHADIQGAPTVILKEGQQAGESERREAAQWAASYSSAWKVGAAAVDVYALRPEQVSKNESGGHAGKGAFFLSGEREWFRSTPLQLKIGKRGDMPILLPALHPERLERMVPLSPGAIEKEDAARRLSAHLSLKADDIAHVLPGGRFLLAI